MPVPIVLELTGDEIGVWAEVAQAIAASFALAAAAWSIVLAGRANRIAARGPWLDELLRLLLDELVEAGRDDNTFKTMCLVPFETLEVKKERREEWLAGRDRSISRLHNLGLIAPRLKHLQALLAQRDAISSGYLDAPEDFRLRMPHVEAAELLGQYEAAAATYTTELRKLAGLLGHMELEGARPRWWRSIFSRKLDR